MKKVTIVLSFVLALVVLSMWGPEAEAFKFYSVGISDTGNCADCHSGYRDTSDYFSNKDGAFWGTSLHNGHLNNTAIGGNCSNCHYGADTSGRQVNLSSSANAADGVNAISCSGCHEPLGLRAHHAANGITDCADCHSDPTPPNEDVAPPWYGSVLNDFTGTNLEPCNANGEEDFAGSTLGLDNDGDNLYDTADPDCAQPPVCGNGTIESGEECDDGNTEDADGCQADCQLPVCGDGIVDPDEQCDDGNTSNDDGCEDDCTLTPDPGECSDEDKPTITEVEYNRGDEKLHIKGRAAAGTTISVINSDTGEILADGIRVRRKGSWEAEIKNVGSNLENIGVISSNGCAINQEV
jgi:cysteine-rich repeat protein